MDALIEFLSGTNDTIEWPIIVEKLREEFVLYRSNCALCGKIVPYPDEVVEELQFTNEHYIKLSDVIEDQPHVRELCICTDCMRSKLKDFPKYDFNPNLCSYGKCAIDAYVWITKPRGGDSITKYVLCVKHAFQLKMFGPHYYEESQFPERVFMKQQRTLLGIENRALFHYGIKRRKQLFDYLDSEMKKKSQKFLVHIALSRSRGSLAKIVNLPVDLLLIIAEQIGSQYDGHNLDASLKNYYRAQFFTSENLYNIKKRKAFVMK